MKKILSQIPDFNDNNAKVSETYHTSGAKIIEVLYGENGYWKALEVNGHYVMLEHKEGDSVGYGTEHNENALAELESDITKREELCKKAEEIAVKSASVNTTGEAMHLRREWNGLYFYGTPRENELKNLFNASLDTYFTNREQERKEREEKKEELIEKADSFSTSTDYKKTTEEMEHLLEAWKAIGSAGADQDEELWNRFKQARDTFFKNKKQYYTERKKVSSENAEKKKELIKEAKEILESEEYSKDKADQMTALMTKWKEIGYTERSTGEKLWKEFRDIMNAYWQAKKQYHSLQHQQWLEKKSVLEAKHQEWLNGMREASERKKEKIAYLTTQNDTLKDRIERSYNPDKKDQIAGWILENENKINQLEADIREIEEKLAKG